ncbi:MAG: plastocyanin [Gammaproteobacteria bacterium]|nr:plastocyanin [Gammaproteobacteria bacterium]
MLLLGGLFFVSGCSNDLPVPKVVEIEIINYGYQPQTVTINPGDTVRWINREKRQYHSVKLDGDGGGGSVNSEYLFPGESWEHTFSQEGVYNYMCGPHSEMVGAVKVKSLI